MTLQPPHETFIRSDADLTRLWRDMMGPGGFAVRSLWHVFFGADAGMLPLVLPIDDLPNRPDDLLLTNLGHVMQEVMADSDAATLAVLLSRPGPAGMTADDRAWARALRGAFGPERCPWPIHLATAGRIQTFAPDDLIAA